MKKDLQTRLINRKVEKPYLILMSIGMWVLRIINKRYGEEFSYDYDSETIKSQSKVLLSSHASRLEFIYTIYGFKRKDVNVTCGFQNVLKKTILFQLILFALSLGFLMVAVFIKL